MRKINYDFIDLEDAMLDLKYNHNGQALNNVKNELNKFFKDSKCKEIIYTKNTDKPFFGMCVIPYITGDLAAKILSSSEKERLSQYYIEIDSKLFDIDFTAQELVAMLLHEVGHIVNDATPVEEVRKSIDFYLHSNDQHLVITKSEQYRDLLAFGIKQAIRNLTSIFKMDDEEIIADEFSVSCGYGPELESAYKKIINKTRVLNKGVPKLVALQWTLRVYRDVKIRRISAIKALNKSALFSGSVLEKREIESAKRDLNQIDDSSLIQQEGAKFTDYIKDMYNKFKYKGIRALEDDMYELSLRVKNVDDQDEALSIIRKINTNLAIIDDYVNSETDINDEQRKRCFDLIDRYNLLRDTVAKKTTYDEKYYGLFVKTPVIKSRYEI